MQGREGEGATAGYRFATATGSLMQLLFVRATLHPSYTDAAAAGQFNTKMDNGPLILSTVSATEDWAG